MTDEPQPDPRSRFGLNKPQPDPRSRFGLNEPQSDPRSRFGGNQPPPSPRQTLSYLRGLFESHGIKPKNKLGQSFLIDLNLVDLIVRVAELSKDDLAVEVGSGTGSLTARLADAAGAVLSVEIDPAFA